MAIVVDRKTCEIIEWYLYNYDSIKQEVESHKMDIIESGRCDITTWGGGVSYHSDPTAQKGVDLCQIDIVERETWLKIIEKVLKKYEGTHKAKFIESKYKRREEIYRTQKKLNIERTTYFTWRAEIINSVALLAAENRLIKTA